MIRPLALIFIVSSLVVGGTAYGQVHVDSGALDSLGTGSSNAEPSIASSGADRSTPARRAPRGRKPAPTRHAASVTKPADKAPKALMPAPKPAPPVTIAPNAPPVAVIPPPTAVPPPHPVAPPLIPMVAGAVGEVTALPGGLRITFGAGKSDLSPATVEILHRISQALIANPNTNVNVLGYAAGAPDDPSTPRRLSLSRVLAVRAVLIGDHVASARIYPRALGSTASDGPVDRVDVQQSGTAAPAPPPGATPSPASTNAPDAPSAPGSGPSSTIVTAPAKTPPRTSTGLFAPRTP